MASTRKFGAIVMAAGLGTRMKSQRAKVLHQLAGIPLIRYPLRALAALEAAPIVVVVGHQAEDVIAACGGFDARFAHQATPRGTGDAVRSGLGALAGFEGDVLIMPSDLPLLSADTLRALVTTHHREQATVSLLTTTVAEPGGYGRIVRAEMRHAASGDRRSVVGIVEDRDCTEAQRAICEVNVGVYCVSARFLSAALARLRPDNAQSELYLTDVVSQAADLGHVVADQNVAPAEVAQISSREDLADVEHTLRLKLARYWMASGVTLEDPATTYIGPEVTLGCDVVIGPNVILRGRTRVGGDSRIDGSSLIIDSVIGDSVHLKFGVVVCEAHVGDRSTVGPFAQLRPGTHLAAGVHIGDFVETKNAIIGAGSKANHLAYIGDAEIGREVNVGAGTITCNYDGLRKSRTVIGDRVMIGSDSQLIAPITVGDDAYVATGTTVRKDVPPGALVFNPKEHSTRAGWVAARRKRVRQAAQIAATIHPTGPGERKKVKPTGKSKPALKRRPVTRLRTRSGAKKRR